MGGFLPNATRMYLVWSYIETSKVVGKVSFNDLSFRVFDEVDERASESSRLAL